MINEKNRVVISACIKFLLVIASCAGILMCVGASGFMGEGRLFLYFTTQSNIWISVLALILGIKQIKNYRGGKYTLSKRDYVAQLVFTVSITLTGVVYCFVLVPAFVMAGTPGFNPLAPSQLLLHVITPVLAAVDFIGFTRTVEFNWKDCLWSALPPLYYLGFSFAGYCLNWNFGGGNNYPYFFLNYGSSVGLFGFGGAAPYFMGTFYWIVAIALFVLGVARLYTAIVNRMVRRLPKKI